MANKILSAGTFQIAVGVALGSLLGGMLAGFLKKKP